MLLTLGQFIGQQQEKKTSKETADTIKIEFRTVQRPIKTWKDMYMEMWSEKSPKCLVKSNRKNQQYNSQICLIERVRAHNGKRTQGIGTCSCVA